MSPPRCSPGRVHAGGRRALSERCAPRWAALLLGFCGAALLPTAHAAEGAGVVPPAVANKLMEVLEQPVGGFPARCGLREARAEGDHALAVFGCEKGARVTFRLARPGTLKAPRVTTVHFAIEVAEGNPPAGLLPALERRVRETEKNWSWSAPVSPRPPHGDGGVPLATAPVGPQSTNESGGRPEPSALPSRAKTDTSGIPRRLEQVLIGLGALLLLCLPLGLAQALRGFQRRALLLFLGVVLLAFVVRALAPHRMVMVYFGYEYVAEAATLEALPRYGPGAPLLWWLLFRFFSPDHAAVQWLHVVLGSLTAGYFALLVARLSGRLAAAGATGLLLALTPLFVRDHGSESMAVPAMLALAAMAVLAAEVVPRLGAAGAGGAGLALDGSRFRGVGRSLAALAMLLLFAAACRPDLAVVSVPILLAFSLAAAPPRVVGLAWARAWPFILGAALFALPLLYHLWLRGQADLARGNLPILSEQFLAILPGWLLHEFVALRPEDFPVGVWLLVVLGTFASPLGRRAWWLVLAAVLSILPTFVDHSETSLLRLQVPAASLLCVAAGLGFAALWERGRGPRLGAVGALLLALLSMVPTVEPLFRDRNPDLEDALIRRARSALLAAPGPARMLFRRGRDDEAERGAHLHFPDYLFESHGIHSRGLGELPQVLREAPPDADLYFLRSFRCYLWSAERRERVGEHPVCRRVCEQHACEPVFEAQAPNRGDRKTFDGYTQQPELTVGLYRLRRR